MTELGDMFSQSSLLGRTTLLNVLLRVFPRRQFFFCVAAPKILPSTMSHARVNIDKVIEGDGKTIPKKGSIVTVHYTGYLADGSKFDSTHDRKQPFRFRVQSGEVIRGWDEGIVQMSLGERSKMTIPPSLAYGSKGFPGLIPANTAITFDVELKGVA